MGDSKIRGGGYVGCIVETTVFSAAAAAALSGASLFSFISFVLSSLTLVGQAEVKVRTVVGIRGVRPLVRETKEREEGRKIR